MNITYYFLVMTAVDLRLLLVAQLYNSMHGLGTDEKALSRIFIIRSEVRNLGVTITRQA